WKQHPRRLTPVGIVVELGNGAPKRAALEIPFRVNREKLLLRVEEQNRLEGLPKRSGITIGRHSYLTSLSEPEMACSSRRRNLAATGSQSSVRARGSMLARCRKDSSSALYGSLAGSTPCSPSAADHRRSTSRICGPSIRPWHQSCAYSCRIARTFVCSAGGSRNSVRRRRRCCAASRLASACASVGSRFTQSRTARKTASQHWAVA